MIKLLSTLGRIYSLISGGNKDAHKYIDTQTMSNKHMLTHLKQYPLPTPTFGTHLALIVFSLAIVPPSPPDPLLTRILALTSILFRRDLIIDTITVAELRSTENARCTITIRFVYEYATLYLLHAIPYVRMLRRVSLPLITPFSHDSLTKTRPLPLISVRLLFILYCYNRQTRCISLVVKFRTTL